MSIDQYAPCPCGSGKKFKWCCQAIFPGIQQAWEQENNGQHETALKIIDRVVAEHANNPEAWGQKASLLLANGKGEAAEEALARAFAINPNYPFGLRLQASIRHSEGEYMGALLLARKAAEVFDPEARETLGELFLLMFDCELRCNRPVAARAALERSVHLLPAAEEVRDTFESMFNQDSRYPPAARKGYTFRPASNERRPSWDRALEGVSNRLGATARAFETLTAEDPTDVNAWFNLGLARAWLGDNKGALAALDSFIEKTDDEAGAVEAATLGEVLRFGYGMEDSCDYQQLQAIAQLNDPERVNRMLQGWHDQHRLLQIPSEQEGLFVAMILELTPTGLVTVGRPAAESGRLAGYFILSRNVMRLAGPVPETFDRLRDEVRESLGLGLGTLQPQPIPPQFHEVVSEALVFPINISDQEEGARRIVEHAGRFYEDTWIHRPRKSLNKITPIDAAGHPRLRWRLLGVLAFLEQCAQAGALNGYDFNRVRQKLGLDTPGAAAVAPAATQADVATMNAEDLAGLDVARLTDEQLEKGYQAAYRLDAQELAARFAGALIARPPVPGRDLYPWVSFLIQKAVREGEFAPALDHVNEGTRLDCEQNEGKRRDDYEFWRAQVHAKQGDVEATRDVYQRLIERTPRNFKFRGKAAEAMLTLKQPARALEFAEQGVTAARQAKDRDSEQYLMELAAAAKKQLG